mgnify:CR=1 FL=1
MASYIGFAPASSTFIPDDSITVAKLNPTGATAGQVFKINDAGNDWVLGLSSSAEIYGFKMTDANSDGVLDSLSVTTTNQGQDSITASGKPYLMQWRWRATGFTFSLNSSGHLIATI